MPEKPGFYPIPADPHTPLDLAAARSASLDEEIELSRYFMRRLTLRHAETTTPVEAALVLNALSYAVISFTRLMRTRLYLQINGEPRDDEFQRWLAGVHASMEAKTNSE